MRIGIVCPYSVTSVTEKIDTTAPADSTVPAHVVPVTSCSSRARPASACSVSENACHGCAPSADTATSR